MLIIIEGPDLVGKTTLALRLAEQFRIPIFKHHKISSKKEWKNTVDFIGHVTYDILKQIDFSKNNLIIDRFFVSNKVYNKFYYRPYDILYLKTLYEDFPTDNIIYIQLTATDNVLIERFKIRSDPYIPIRHILELNKLFLEEYKNIKYKKILMAETTTFSDLCFFILSNTVRGVV